MFTKHEITLCANKNCIKQPLMLLVELLFSNSIKRLGV